MVSSYARVSRDAAITDSRIFLYAEQRHRLPLSARRAWSSVGFGIRSSSAFVVMIWPDVQKPHWKPLCSTNACWIGCSASSAASPSIVRTSPPVASTRQRRARVDVAAVQDDGAGAALRAIAAHLRAGQLQVFAQELQQRRAVRNLLAVRDAVHLHLDERPPRVGFGGVRQLRLGRVGDQRRRQGAGGGAPPFRNARRETECFRLSG